MAGVCGPAVLIEGSEALDVYDLDAPIATYWARYIADGAPEDSLRYLQISSGGFVWQDETGGDGEIQHWDGSGATNLSNDPERQRYPAISGTRFAWSGKCETCASNEIFVMDEGVTVQITDNGVSDLIPAIDGVHVVWQQIDDSGPGDPDWEIFH
jgi:hypothetical protein